MATPTAPKPGDENAPLLSKGSANESTTQTYGAATTTESAAEQETNSSAGPANSQPENEEEEDDEDLDPVIAEARKRMPIIFSALALGILMTSIDGSLVNAIYGEISSSFNRLDLAPWISTSFFLTLGCVSTLYGKLSDIFGRKPCLIVAFTGFGIGSCLCGAAPSMEMFIAARVIQALGGGGIGICTTVMLSDIVSIRDRATWQAYVNLVVALGGFIGAPIGGLLADKIGWRWTFYIQVPLIVLAALNVFFFLHLPPRESGPWIQQVRKIDFSGAILLVCVVFSLLFGMNRGSQSSFSDPEAWVPLAAFPILLILFIFNEVKFASNPFLPPHAMKNRTVLATFAASFLSYGAFAALVFVIPLWFQAVDGVGPTQAGIRILPVSIFSILANVLGGRLLKWTGRYYTFFLLGNICAAVFMIVVFLATVFPQHDLLFITGGAMLTCAGFGVALASSLIALLANISKEDQATLTACMFTLRYVGSAVAISACGTLINAVLQRDLLSTLSEQYPSIDAGAVTDGVLESLDYIRHIQDAVLQHTIRMVYAGSIRWAFVLQGALWAAAAAFCLIVKPGRLPGTGGTK